MISMEATKTTPDLAPSKLGHKDDTVVVVTMATETGGIVVFMGLGFGQRGKSWV